MDYALWVVMANTCSCEAIVRSAFHFIKIDKQMVVITGQISIIPQVVNISAGEYIISLQSALQEHAGTLTGLHGSKINK